VLGGHLVPKEIEAGSFIRSFSRDEALPKRM
jgi:hypothetical protein